MVRVAPGGIFPESRCGVFREPSGSRTGLTSMPAATHFSLRDDWRALKRGRPGRRFQERYERARGIEAHCGLAKRVGIVVVAVVAFLLGLFFAVFPGPAIPFFLLAAALLATHSRPLARALDWLEVRLRELFLKLRRTWRRLPLVGRVVLAVVALACPAALTYFAYRWMRG